MYRALTWSGICTVVREEQGTREEESDFVTDAEFLARLARNASDAEPRTPLASRPAGDRKGAGLASVSLR